MKALYTKTELADAFTCSLNTIDNYRKEGMPRTGSGRGTKYPLNECIDWLIDHKHKQKLRQLDLGSKMLSEKEAKAKKASFDVLITELDYFEARKSLVKVERVTQYVEAMATQLKDAVLGIPATWADKVIGLSDRPAAIDTLDKLSRDLLNSLSEQELEVDD